MSRNLSPQSENWMEQVIQPKATTGGSPANDHWTAKRNEILRLLGILNSDLEISSLSPPREQLNTWSVHESRSNGPCTKMVTMFWRSSKATFALSKMQNYYHQKR